MLAGGGPVDEMAVDRMPVCGMSFCGMPVLEMLPGSLQVSGGVG